MQQQQVKSRSASRCLFVATAAVAPTIFAASIASAATRDWSSTAATSAWATGSNWDGGTAPASSNADAAQFNKTSYLNQPDTGTRTVGGIIVGDGTTATAALTISGTSLALGSGGVGTGITINANAGQTTITTALSLGANQSWTNNSSNLFTVGSVNLVNRGLTITGSGDTLLTGSITGTTGTITKSGSGKLLFGAANLFSISGALAVSGGTVDLNGYDQTLTGVVTNNATITNSDTTKTVNFVTGGGPSGAAVTGTYSGRMNVTWNHGTPNTTFTGTFSNTGDITLNATAGTIHLSAGSPISSRATFDGAGNVVLNSNGGAVNGSASYAHTGDVTFNANSAATVTANGLFANAGNVVLNVNSTGNITGSSGSFNNTGQVLIGGTGTGTVSLAEIGANITKVIQSSANSPLTLSVASPSWTSGLLIKAGTVNLGNNVNAAGAATNVLTIGDAAAGANATLNVTASNGASAQPIVIAAGGGTRTISNTAAPNPTFSGPVTLHHDLIVLNASTNNGGSGLALSGGIGGIGNLLLQGNSTTTTEGFYQGVRLTGGGVGNVLNNTGSITNAGTGAHDTIISAAIGENVTGVIQNSATSRLVLAGDNTYTAPTTVTAGTLQLAAGGSLANGNITVASSGTFETEGQTGDTEEEPEITPASILTFNIDDATTFDTIANAGTVTLGGDITLDFAATLAGDTFVDLFTGSGSYSSTVGQVLVSGAYSGALSDNGGSLFSGTFGNQEISFNAATGDLAVTAAVPEPGSLAAIGLAAAGLLLRRRRR